MKVSMVLRAAAPRLLGSVALVATLAAGAAWADDDVGDTPTIADDSGVDDGGWVDGDPGDGADGGEVIDPGEWVEDPIAWSVPPEEGGAGDGEGEPVADCDGCEMWATGGEAPLEAQRDVIADRPDPRGREGGTCSEDGFLPLPFRCDW